MAARVEWDEAEFQAWFRDPAGPVLTDLMPRLGALTAASARSRYHRRTGNTADSIHYETGCDSQGPYCNVGGSYVIRFLEKPASQMHQAYRWLSDAVREIAGALSRTTRRTACDESGGQEPGERRRRDGRGGGESRPDGAG